MNNIEEIEEILVEPNARRYRRDPLAGSRTWMFPSQPPSPRLHRRLFSATFSRHPGVRRSNSAAAKAPLRLLHSLLLYHARGRPSRKRSHGVSANADRGEFPRIGGALLPSARGIRLHPIGRLSTFLPSFLDRLQPRRPKVFLAKTVKPLVLDLIRAYALPAFRIRTHIKYVERGEGKGVNADHADHLIRDLAQAIASQLSSLIASVPKDEEDGACGGKSSRTLRTPA